MNQQTHMINFTIKTYQRLLILYPQPFRNQFGEEMLQVFKTKSNITYANKGKWGLIRFQLSALLDLMTSTVREHFSMGSVIKTFKSKSILYILMMFALSGTFYYTYTHWEKMPYPFPAPRNVIQNRLWHKQLIREDDINVYIQNESFYSHSDYMFFRNAKDIQALLINNHPGQGLDRTPYSKFNQGSDWGSFSIYYVDYYRLTKHFNNFYDKPSYMAAKEPMLDTDGTLLYYSPLMPTNAWQVWTPLYTALFPLLWAGYGLVFAISRRFSFWEKLGNALMLTGGAGLGILQFHVLYTGNMQPLWLWFSYSTLLLSLGLLVTTILTIRKRGFNFITSMPFLLAGLLIAQDLLRYNTTIAQPTWTQLIVILFTMTNILWTAWGIATLRQADEVHIKQVLFA